MMKSASESGRPEARNFWRASFALGAADEIEAAFLLDELELR